MRRYVSAAPNGNDPGDEAFILTPRAEQDVSDIRDYIADDSIEAADRVLAALENTMHRGPANRRASTKKARALLDTIDTSSVVG